MTMIARGPAAAVFAAAAFFTGIVQATPALAGDTDVPADITISGYVQGVSDYRFRGMSLTNGDFAVQASVNINHVSGFYAGTWASNLEQDAADVYGSSEVDLYAGWAGEVASGLTADVNLAYYVYPAGSGGALKTPGNFWEGNASLTKVLGPASAKVGIGYAWGQQSLDFDGTGTNDDNLYLYTDINVGVPQTPVTISGHLGYTDGALSNKGTGNTFDYSIGGTYNLTPKLSFGVAYLGIGGPSVENRTDDTVLGTLKLAF